jgi:hypothetical protein
VSNRQPFSARLDDDREVEFYPCSILVSVETSHGRRKLHTFYSEFDAKTGEHISRWILTTPPSHKQAADKRRRLASDDVSQWRPALSPPARRETGAKLREQLDPGTIVHLAPGVDVSIEMLTVVLDALHSASRNELDVEDLKVVVSQLGSLINRLDTVDEVHRRHATQALYAEILRRCTRV